MSFQDMHYPSLGMHESSFHSHPDSEAPYNYMSVYVHRGVYRTSYDDRPRRHFGPNYFRRPQLQYDSHHTQSPALSTSQVVQRWIPKHLISKPNAEYSRFYFST
ncbi:hypothetical protein GUJ93_ZPchr0160g6434 [Zizania palustris]|uniref:Uncharacterized protein n=1 Tax=Zizania palustris TaxID=103762 RepID=A0A8J5X2P9_ZIZPA|nr:hypothetical protein GUJ93_ZPchr0160g6434 [Zizania palustris]